MAAGTIVLIDNIGSGTITASTGMAAIPVPGRGNNRGLTVTEEVVYAYQGTAAAPTFLAAIANKAFGTPSAGLLTNTGLTAGLQALDLALPAGADVAAYTGARSGQADFGSYLPLINNPTNWITQDGGGDQSTDQAPPDVPFSASAFSTGPQEAPLVAVVASDALAAEGSSSVDTGTFLFTRTGPTTTDLIVTYQVSGTATNGSDAERLSGTVTIPSGKASTSLTVTPVNDGNAAEGPETIILTLVDGAAYDLGASTSAMVTVADNTTGVLKRVGGAKGTGAEIPAFDSGSDRLFVVAGNTVEIYGVGASGALSALGSLAPGFTPPPGTESIPNSVAVRDGLVAVAYAIRDTATSAQKTGRVSFFNATDGVFLKSVEVGYLPDMVTFSPDGTKVLTANEGEPNSYGQANSFDPEGSVSVIDLSGGVSAATVQTAGFTGFNGQRSSLMASGVRITGPGSTVAQDLEPEYITFSSDGSQAYVTLQENNAIAIVAIATATVLEIRPLGLKDFNQPSNGIDANDTDGRINIQQWPVYGMYQPDGIASYTVNGETYFITANEGDSRNYTGFNEEIRVGATSYGLDPTAFPLAATLKLNTNLGRLQVTNASGDTDGDGDFDRIEAYGARSFSIWDGNGNRVFDSGNQLELITAAQAPSFFNSDGSFATPNFDSRSDNKGPEPEGVVIGVVNNLTYAFIGMERTGDVIVYEVTNPLKPQFIEYLNAPEDVGPEGLTFITAADSPTGNPLVVTANEGIVTGTFFISPTVAVYEFSPPPITRIHEIQGSGPIFNTALAGSRTIEGIVTGTFFGPARLNGFYVQEEDADVDLDAATSEGIFIHDPTGQFTGSVGTKVRVTGTVGEFTSIGSNIVGIGNSSLTQLSNPVVINLGPASLPSFANVQLPLSDTTVLERYESMLVNVAAVGGPLTVTETFKLGRFGQVGLSANGRLDQYTQVNNPSVSGYAAYLDNLQDGYIILDDGSTVQNPDPVIHARGGAPLSATNTLRGGDTIASISGVLDHRFEGYRVQTTTPANFMAANSRESTAPDVGGSLRVASLNLLNFFNGDGSGSGFPTSRGAESTNEFNRQRSKTVATILGLDADLIAYSEMENDGYGPTSAVQALVDDLNAVAGAGTYSFVVPPAAALNPAGGFGGDEITVGFLYRTPAVRIAPGTQVAALTTGAFAQEAAQRVQRPALAATFEQLDSGTPTNALFTAVANHFKSKGSSAGGAGDGDNLDGQGLSNGTRTRAAGELATWLATNPTGSADTDTLILGDLNAYRLEDPIQTLTNAGYVNLFDPESYSYQFNGQWGALDHALVSSSLATQVSRADKWHSNADEPVVLDYNTNFKSPAQQASFFNADPFRSSDHDPLVIGLDLKEEDRFTLQILHASDFEGGIEATQRAKNFAAIVDVLEDQVVHSTTLSSGDNFIPGAFTAGGTDPSLRDEIASYYEQLFGLATGSLTGIRNGTLGFNQADIAILNAIGVQASVLGNHDFDLGPSALSTAFDFIATLPQLPAQPTLASITSIGAQFPYLSANLNFAAESTLSGLFTAALQDAGAYATTATELSTGAGIRAEATGRELSPWTTLREGGEIIGVLGLTTQVLNSISTLGNVSVLDPAGDGGVDNMAELAQLIQPYINQMTDQGINKIILLTHLQQFINEQTLAPLLSGVDVIIGGGSNTLLADATDPLEPGVTADGTYPIFASGTDGNPIAIVNTDGNYNYVGRLVVDFDADGHILPASVEPATSGAYVTTDQGVDAVAGNGDGSLSQLEMDRIFADGSRGGEVKQITDAIAAVIAAKDGNVLGFTDVFLEGRRNEVRSEETNLGNLTADANLAVAKAFDTSTIISLKNGGGIRAEIGAVVGQPVPEELPPLANPAAGKPAGGISQLDIENSLRFNNTLALITLTAQGVLNMVENALRGANPGTTPGAFPQIGGIAFSWDKDRSPLDRVVDLVITNQLGDIVDVIADNGRIIGDPSRSLRMATLGFLIPANPASSPGDNIIVRGDTVSETAPGVVTGTLAVYSDFSALNRVDLTGAGSGFNQVGSEQAALADYLSALHGTKENAFNAADTTRALDERIQNLDFRADTVNPAGTGAVLNSAEDDVIVGTSAANSISGGAGDDSIFGVAGNDTLVPGIGNDMVDGGSGTDTVVLAGPRDGASLVRSATGTWSVTTATDGTDSLSDVELLQFSDGKLDITGLFAVQPVSQLSAGDVDQDSAVLLAKLTHTGTVTFEIATDESFSNLVAPSEVVSVNDAMVPAKLQLADGTLTPGTRYFWRATDGDGETDRASFRTPDAVTVQNGFSMGVSGDWRGELAPYPAISNAATAGLDLFVKLGDTIYADYPSPALNQPQALTLADYRAKHNEVYGGQAGLDAWGDLQKTTPILAMIDDHEVINDFAGGAPASSDPRFATANGLINDTTLYENGLTVFLDYNAIEDRTYADTGTAPVSDGEHKLYRYSQQGKDAAVFLLDARSFRDDELTPVTNLTDQAQIGTFLAQSFDPSRTLLGNAQLTQLKADLLDAQARGVVWKFIQVPEPIQNFGVLGAQDRFEGYAAERTALLKFIKEEGLTGVVFVSADIHGSVVNNLTYQEVPGGPQIAVAAWEITTGAVAFDAPFGQTVFELASAAGLIDSNQQAFYNSLPIAPDTDSSLNDKDDFIKSLTNQQFKVLGYDPVGLNDNLPQASGLIDANLVSGDYMVTHGYGWTEFDVDGTTGQLSVTTYGVPYYSTAQAAADPAAIAALTPSVMAQFTVKAPASVTPPTELSDDIIGTPAGELIRGVEGNSPLRGKGSIDTLTGMGGKDTFLLGDAQGLYYDDASNTTAGNNDFAYIKDFTSGDRIQLPGKAGDYVLGSGRFDRNSPRATIIYYKNPDRPATASPTRPWSRDEWIGMVLTSDSANVLNLTDPNQFTYVSMV